MEKTYWVLTHKETGNIWQQSICDTKEDCIKFGCNFLERTEDELKVIGFTPEEIIIERKGK